MVTPQRMCMALGAVVGLASISFAQEQPASPAPQFESVYAPPRPPTPDEGTNMGGAHINLSANYATDYIYRGREVLEPAGPEDSPTYQLDTKISFDLGKMPHPFFGIFSNMAEKDQLSRIQEIRPYAGASWTLRPLTLTAGATAYIFPDRSALNTSEGFAKLSLDDGFFNEKREPFLSPYVMVAYDIDKYDGWYAEMGISHAFKFEELGFTLTVHGNVGFVDGNELYRTNGYMTDTGFQHYEVGVTGTYALNSLLNIPKRYGDWSLVGFMNYTDGIDRHLDATRQIWGGCGLQFEY